MESSSPPQKTSTYIVEEKKKHLYWTAATSSSGPERVAKWTSILNHVRDIHTHEDPLYPQCLYPSCISRDKGKWLKEGTPAFHKLDKVLTNKRVLKDVEKLSPHFQTLLLESFHSVILRFAPKNVVFPFTGMLCRLYLAVLHFSENAGRPRVTSDGHFRATVSIYVDKLMDLIFEEVFQDPVPYTKEIQQIPVPRTSVPDLTDLTSWKSSPATSRGSIEGWFETHIASFFIGKLLPHPQHHTGR